MEMGESLVMNRNVLRRNLRMAVDLDGPAGKAGVAPGSDITGEMWQNITIGKEAASGADARVSQVVNLMKN